jgi:hypothetical protein
LFGAILQLRGIGIFALAVGAVAPNVNDGLAVTRPVQIRDPQPIVTLVGGDRAPLVIDAPGERTGAGRWLGDQDVVHAAVARHPGDAAAGRRRHEVGWKRRRHQRVDREWRGLLG